MCLIVLFGHDDIIYNYKHPCFFYDNEELKLISHGCKLNKFEITGLQIEAIMLNIRFLSSWIMTYETIDKGLILPLMKMWHVKTILSTFLLVGEKTIIFDDTSLLLHILIVGQFCTVDLLWLSG